MAIASQITSSMTVYSTVLKAKKTSELSITGPLWKESTINQWITLKRASHAKNISISWHQELQDFSVSTHDYEKLTFSTPFAYTRTTVFLVILYLK